MKHEEKLDEADKRFFRFLDAFQVHFLYWTIIILIVELLSK